MTVLSADNWDTMTADERKTYVLEESNYIEGLLWTLDMIEAGLAVRRAGLIWVLPLCHDSYGENI